MSIFDARSLTTTLDEISSSFPSLSASSQPANNLEAASQKLTASQSLAASQKPIDSLPAPSATSGQSDPYFCFGRVEREPFQNCNIYFG